MNATLKSVRLLERLTASVLAHGKGVLAVAAVITVALGWFLPRLELDVSAESFLQKDDPDLALIQEVADRFGSAVPTVLAYRDAELFTPEGLARLDRLTDRIAGVPFGADHLRRPGGRSLVAAGDDRLAATPQGATPVVTAGPGESSWAMLAACSPGGEP